MSYHVACSKYIDDNAVMHHAEGRDGRDEAAMEGEGEGEEGRATCAYDRAERKGAVGPTLWLRSLEVAQDILSMGCVDEGVSRGSLHCENEVLRTCGHSSTCRLIYTLCRASEANTMYCGILENCAQNCG